MQHKKKLLLVGPSPRLHGGVSTSVKNFLNSELKLKYKLIYLQTGKGAKLQSSRLSVFSRTFYQLLSYLKLILFKKIDIIHIHSSSWGGFWRFSLYVFFGKLSNKNVIMHIHGAEFKSFYGESNIFLKFIISAVLESTERLIVLSKHWKDYFEEISPKVSKIIVENSVSLTKLNIERNYNSDVKKVLFLGGLTARKGVNELLEAIPKIKDKNENILFTVAGFPLKNEKLLLKRLERAEEQGLLDLRVNISNDTKSQLFLDSHIFLLQSFDEGLPFTILEAMSYGLPVVSTPVGAIPEVIVEEENGILISPGKSNQLVEKILELISNVDLLKKMQTANLLKIKNHYSTSVMINKIEKIYESL